MTVWAAICADIRFRCRLRHGGRETLLGLARAAFCSRGTLVLASQRLAHSSAQGRGSNRSLSAKLLRIFAAIGHKLAIVLAKSEIPSSCAIAAPVWLSDRGHLVLGAERIGRGTVIHDRVTLGSDLSRGDRPVIGENVWIGPGCVVFGAIHVGDGATVLSGSVVSKRVPPHAVVSGNPARIVTLDFDNEPLRSGSGLVESAEIIRSVAPYVSST